MRGIGWRKLPDTGKIYLTGATYVCPDFSSFSTLKPSYLPYELPFALNKDASIMTI